MQNLKLLKGHQGKQKGQRRPWPAWPVCNSQMHPSAETNTSATALSSIIWKMELSRSACAHAHDMWRPPCMLGLSLRWGTSNLRVTISLISGSFPGGGEEARQQRNDARAAHQTHAHPQAYLRRQRLGKCQPFRCPKRHLFAPQGR